MNLRLNRSNLKTFQWPLTSVYLSFSLFMAPRDSGIATELDLELDEGSYEEEEEGNMDEERWGTLVFVYHFSRKYCITNTHTLALSSLRFECQMTANKPRGFSVFASEAFKARSNIAVYLKTVLLWYYQPFISSVIDWLIFPQVWCTVCLVKPSSLSSEDRNLLPWVFMPVILFCFLCV